MSQRPPSSNNGAPSSSSGYSNVSSVAEVARPGTSSGPRTTTANTHLYAMERRGVDDSIQRDASPTSVPSYHSSRPPTYRSQQPSGSSDRASGGSDRASGGSDRASRGSDNVSDPPSYHSADRTVPAPQPSSEGPGSGQQARPQTQPPRLPSPQPTGDRRLSTRERAMRLARNIIPGSRNQGSGSGGRR